MRNAKTIIAQNAKLKNPYPMEELVEKFVPVDPVGKKIYQPDVDISVEASYSAEKILTNKTISADQENNTIQNARITSQFEINFSDPSSNSLMLLNNMLVLNMDVIVVEAWNGDQANNSLKVGDDTTDDGFVSELGGLLGVLGTTGYKTAEPCSRGGSYIYGASCGGPIRKYYDSDSTENLVVTIGKDSACTSGRAIILIEYILFEGWGGTVTPSGGFSNGFSDGFN